MTEQQATGITVYMADDRTPSINFPKAQNFNTESEHLVVRNGDRTVVAAFRPGLWTYAINERFRK